ncbi:DUF3870 domain-containing protein [Metabacillus herbersteinensis]|uniref:DUF3870 domain-containing protein n=1 Tax=Metabacillus herbersteinensis TaxID=283816 RepID=A0ABV6GIR7_9BACI
MRTEDTVLVTGFAQVPKGTTLYETYKTIAVVLVINYKTEVIEDAEFTFLTDLTNYYLSDLVKGYNFSEGFNPLFDKVKKHCLLPSQGAIIQAIRSAFDRYQETKPS